MKTFPEFDTTVRQGQRFTTVTLTARSRCGDFINAKGRAATEHEAISRAATRLAARNAESAALCAVRGKHNHG